MTGPRPTESSLVKTPTSRCRVGLGRVDITPPVGIYHRFWGAAKHDRATGVHRPLTASVLVLSPWEAKADGPKVIVAIDHCLFRPADMDAVLDETARRIGASDRSRITFAFSHTHSGGHIARERSQMPGGELIGPYLEALPGKIFEAYHAALSSLTLAVFTYGSTTCWMGNNRDAYDSQSRQWVCGFNAEKQSPLPVNVVRMTSAGRAAGELIGTIVSYPCHPTTLAWDNTLISPDYVGALRETVETATGAPCVFLLAPCGDVGPRHGFVGDTAATDRNGRHVAYAALQALEGLAPTGCDYHYAGPVTSGATIGTWEYRPHSSERQAETSVFRRRSWNIAVPLRADLPGARQIERELASLLGQEAIAASRGEDASARELRALAERQRRVLERVGPISGSEKYPYAVEALQIGDAFWVFVEGEPYHALQEQLARRFSQRVVLAVTLANGSRPSYLPTREAYEHELYEVDVSLLAAGCLERVVDALASQIEAWLSE